MSDQKEQTIFEKHRKLLHDTIFNLSGSRQMIDLKRLEDLQKSFETTIAEISQEGRNLNIAIMGQVKAGKSSFLNALLFKGKPVLPTAATPKTANLTRITYGKQAKIEIEFYSQEEWRAIEKSANHASESNEAGRVAAELVKMVRDNSINTMAKIGKGKEEIYAKSADPLEASSEIMEKLEDYVGNNGQYTPLVKMTYLYLPLEDLEGFNIIDTPGMNDPVISRGMKTQEEMSRADVVFFLSHCSHFLGDQDKKLLADQLPSKGVRNIVFVGGQFDSAILDAGRDYESLEETLEELRESLLEQAETEMRDSRTAQKLENLKITGPIFSSTYAYLFATVEKKEWENQSSMGHVYNQLNKIAENCWDDYQWTEEDWLNVGNFQPLVDAYQQARVDKDQIIAQRLADAVPNAEKEYKNVLENLKEDAINNLTSLKTNKIADLHRQRDESQNKIKKISEILSTILQERCNNMKEASEKVMRELEQRYRQAKNRKLTARTGSEMRTKKEEYEVEVSNSSWWNPLSWWSTKTETRTRTVDYRHTYQYFSPTEAAGIVSEMARECKNNIEFYLNRDFIQKEELKEELLAKLVEFLPMDNEDFDSANLRRLIERQIQSLTIPTFSLSDRNYDYEITRGFDTEVTSNSEQNKLTFRMEQAMSEVYNSLSNEVKDRIKDTERKFKKLEESIQPDLVKSLKDDLDKKERELENAQDNIAKYEKLMPLLDKYLLLAK